MFQVIADANGDLYLATPEAASNWGDRDSIRGMATSSLMARAAEGAVRASGTDARQPARWTADLSRPVALRQPCRVVAVVRRNGRRVCLVDVVVRQEGNIVARGRGLFAATQASAAPSSLWTSDRELPRPPRALAQENAGERLYHSEGTWTAQATNHGNDSPKTLWQPPFRVVDDESPTPFQVAAAVADLASVATHWGVRGVTFINADITMNLVRLPELDEPHAGIGVTATERMEQHGIALGTAILHDPRGPFGLATVSALSNQHNAVDPGWRDGGGRLTT